MQLKDAVILVVDDEVGLLRIFARWFEREGCRVLSAENGRDALELIMANHVDLVVSDIRMPVLDGIELARRIKARSKYLPKIVFISGFHDLGDRESFDLGVEASLAKPVDREVLVAAARRCLMDRAELWSAPPASSPETTIDAVFPSLAAAHQQGLIAFGRGGVCVRSSLAVRVAAPIGLHIEFAADRHALTGQGIVRWLDQHDAQIGIEITYVDDAQRAWVVQLAEHNELACFIPRSSS